MVLGTEGLDSAIAVTLVAAFGGLFGLAADRLAARWPAHEDGSIRPIDWRTPVVVVVSAVAFAMLWQRFPETVERVAFGAWFAALVVLLATDLDQRLLPDVITLPAIPLAFLFGLSGANPLLAGGLSFGIVGAVVAAVVLPGGLYLLSLPFGQGAIGLGDVKLLVSVALVAGFGRAFIGLFAGAIVMAIVVIILLVMRRITLRSYVPMGPFLIGGAMWAVLLPGMTLG